MTRKRPTKYKYEVAFSFLAGDESLATQLNDLLQPRLSTFIYSRRQGEIAGTDGEKIFNTAFGKQSRVVVVLYRAGWGKTPWTRIEETAIRNRAYDDGYTFALFIPLDDPPSVPKWFPRTQLWIGLKRWGAAGAASAIESRVQELGGEPHEEGVIDRAARLQRSLDFEAKRKTFLNSPEGVFAANAEFDVMKAEIERLAKEISAQAPAISLRTKSAEGQVVVLGLGLGLSAYWSYRYSNSLDGAQLKVSVWDDHPPFPGIMHFGRLRELRAITFTFDLAQSGDHCWVAGTGSQQRSYSSGELASFALGYLMEQGDPSRGTRQ